MDKSTILLGDKRYLSPTMREVSVRCESGFAASDSIIYDPNGGTISDGEGDYNNW